MPVQWRLPQLPNGVASFPGVTAGGAVPNCTVKMTPNGGTIFLAAFSIAYASVPVNPFKGHGPSAGDWVIATFTDPVTHMYLCDGGGTTDTIY
jgi:hypothetical protein